MVYTCIFNTESGASLWILNFFNIFIQKNATKIVILPYFVRYNRVKTSSRWLKPTKCVHCVGYNQVILITDIVVTDFDCFKQNNVSYVCMFACFYMFVCLRLSLSIVACLLYLIRNPRLTDRKTSVFAG